MANIKFSRKVFEKEIGRLDEKMQQKIALFGTTLESFDNDEIELEIFPDRPDLLSYQGFKRSFLAFLGKKTGLRSYRINSPEKNYVVKVDSSVKSVRPYTVCAIARGIKFDDERIKEIVELQEKLHSTVGRRRRKLAIGVYPLEDITLPITYKALEPDKIKFVPLEAKREMSGLQILQKHPTGKDYAHLLAGKTKFPVFVDAKGDVLSMPPIINSEKTGRVTTKTRDVFIECSGFDLGMLQKCLTILVTAAADMGAKIYQMKVRDMVTPDFSTTSMSISLDNVNKLLGLSLKEKELKQCLEKMGHSYKNGSVEIASWRVDILHEVDLIEDIAIAYGYEHFEPEIPRISTIGQESAHEIIKRKIAEVLIGLGSIELSNYHLTRPEDQFAKMGIPEKFEEGHIELEESKTEYTILRKDLSHYMLKIISENVDSEYPQKLFEMGRVFEFSAAGEVVESDRLSYAYAPGNFTDVLQVLDYLSLHLNVSFSIKEQEKVDLHFIDGRSADIYVGDVKVGVLGEIHPKILKAWKIKMPVALFELDLEKVFEGLS